MYDMIIVTAVALSMLVAMASEKVEPHLVALYGMAVLMITGVLSTDQALSVFSNSAAMTVACMFILSATLEEVGIIRRLGQFVLLLAEKNRNLAILAMIVFAAFVSAFMNNTPVVMILTPVVISVAAKLNDYPSRFLIPLSYATILGGTTTLIGTSTNLIVDGTAQSLGLPAFSMFEFLLEGAIIATVGILYLFFLGPRLLPQRPHVDDELLEDAQQKQFVAEAVIPMGSHLIGRTLNEIKFTPSEGYEVVDLVRKNPRSIANVRPFSSPWLFKNRSKPNNSRSTLRDIPLIAGDRLVFRADKSEVLKLKNVLGISFENDDEDDIGPTMSARGTLLEEGVVSPYSHLIGRRPNDAELRRRYGCYVVAVHREAQNLISNLEEIELRFGDVVLIEGTQDGVNRLFESGDVQQISEASADKLNPFKSMAAILIFIMVIGLATFNVMPISGLALIGCAAVIAFGCITPEHAYNSIKWPIMILLFGSLALARAMESSGVITEALGTLQEEIQLLGPWGVVALVYVLSSFLTNFISNNAVAAVLVPVAVGLAHSLGMDTRPLLIAVIFGSSAAFATPIGYQTNTYVYNIGNYRFSDFFKIGLPMNAVMFVTFMIATYLLYDL